MDLSPLLFLSLGFSGGADDPLCSLPRRNPAFVRSPDETQVVGEVLEERVRDHDWGWGREVFRRDAPPRTGHPEASLVEIGQMEVEGAAADRVGAGTEVAVVIWSLGEGCEWASHRDQLEPGTQHHLRMTLRPDSLWIDGRPTFDVEPGQLAFPGITARYQGVPLEIYLDFIRRTPTVDAWEEDCRPTILSLEKWGRTYPRYAPGPPFEVYELRDWCNPVLKRHARGLHREAYSPDPPQELLAWAEGEGCVPGQYAGEERHLAAEGRFTESGLPEWAMLCASSEQWRLVILTLDEPVHATELVSMAGDAQGWSIRTVPPEYFEWMTAVEFDRGSSPLPRPDRDVILLRHRSRFPLAFFQAELTSSRRWMHAEVDCCRWAAEAPHR